MTTCASTSAKNTIANSKYKASITPTTNKDIINIFFKTSSLIKNISPMLSSLL